jgi:hypothetical protein
MTVLDVREFVAENDTILNTIRDNGSPEYFNRVPEATQATLQDTLAALTSYEPIWNEFVSAFINKVGLTVFRTKTWQNKLAKWKTGILPSGDSIEEIYVGFIKARTYNYDREHLEKDIFGTYKPEVQASYHKINRQEYYPITVNEELLKRAILQPNGLSSFVASLMASPANSDAFDEFIQMTSLLKEWYKDGGFFKIHIDDVSAEGSTPEQAKYALRRLRELAGNLEVPSTKYNAARMPSFANADELELLATPEFLAAIDVEALAGAFNIDKANVSYRVTVIPREYWGIPGAQAILTTSDFFVMTDTLFRTTSQPNPITLATNFFFHHHSILSLSRFAPAILLTTEAGTDDAIVETPVTGISAITVADETGATVTSVQRGGMYQVIGNAITEGNNDAIRVVLSGNESTKTRYYNQTNTLYVSDQDTANTLTLTAYAVDGDIDLIPSTTTVTVVGDRLQLWTNPSIEPDADNDGLEEVTPLALVVTDTNKVVIPSVTGVQYKRAGTDVANGSIQTISGSTVFTAVARTGKELAAGAVASWTLAP